MLTRRRALQLGAGAVAAGSTLGLSRFPAIAQTPREIVIGYVSPQTGPLAAFGETDAFVLAGIRKQLAGGISIGGTKHPVRIVVKDSQSKPNRAGEVAADLILKDKIDLMLVAWTPETTNPVSDQCELNGTPCISTCTPWQAWFFGRKGDPKTGFDWTYHFFWGLEDIISVYTGMWTQVSTNKIVGGLFPNDGDGNAWGDPEHGLPPVLTKQGYTIVDPGRYQDLTTDYSAQIRRFKEAGTQIITGVPLPPDFKNFWTQAAQQGLRPKIATIAKAVLFPSTVEAIGKSAYGLSSEVWWSPNNGFSSSLTHQTSAEFAAAWEASTSKQWTQPLGCAHALFEVGLDVLKRTHDIDSKASIRDAIATTNVKTMVGPVAWGHGPVKNVAKTLLVGGQWIHGKKFPFDLAIVENKDAPQIPVQGKLHPLGA
ncbi:MAG: ABC transporter substrate-binding protein [Candidatus Velthaea sp.]